MADNTIINNLKVLNNPVNSAKIIKASDLNEAFRSTSLITANLLDILGGGSSNEYIPNSEYPMPPGNIIDNTTTSGIIKNIMSQWLDNYTYKHAHRKGKDTTPTDRDIAHRIISANLYDNKEDIAFGNLIPLYKINFDEYGHFKNTSNILDELENNDSIKTINEMYVGNLSLDGYEFNTKNYATNYVIAGPTLQKDRGAIRSRLLPLIQNVDSIINNINVNGIYRVKKGISGKSGILIISAHNYDKETPKTKAIRIFISDDNIIYTNTGEYTVDSSNKITNITWSNTWTSSHNLMLNTIVQDTNIQTNFNHIQHNIDAFKNDFQEFSFSMFIECKKRTEGGSGRVTLQIGDYNPFSKYITGLSDKSRIYDLQLNIKYTAAKKYESYDRPQFIVRPGGQVFNTPKNRKAIIDWLVNTVLPKAWNVINISGELYFFNNNERTSENEEYTNRAERYEYDSSFKMLTLTRSSVVSDKYGSDDNITDEKNNDNKDYLNQITVDGIFNTPTVIKYESIPLWSILNAGPLWDKPINKRDNPRTIETDLWDLEEDVI